MNGYLSCPGVYCVLSDGYQIVYDIVSELIAAGRKRILFLYDSNSYSASEKRRGYEEALKENQIPVADELEVFGQNKVLKVKDMLLKRKLQGFDAVLATDDGLAVGALKYVRELGYSVPQEVNIIGFNDSELAVCCEPELSSVDNRGELLCSTIVESMNQLLTGHSIQQKKVVPCYLVKRKTTNF